MTSLFGQPRHFQESGLLAETRRWTLPDAIHLDNGQRFGAITVAFQTYGVLNAPADNGVLVCHSLTGDCHAAGRMAEGGVVGWWDPLIGPGRAFDTDKCFVVCASVLGGCGGTTGAASTNPETGAPYGAGFPDVTVRDMVNVHAALLHYLGVRQLAGVSGPSMGGSQAWQFAVSYPDLVRNCIPVAASPVAGAFLIGFNAVGRRAIEADPHFSGGNYYGGPGPDAGLSLARQIATMTYYSPPYLECGFSNERGAGGEFAVEDFLADEGARLVARFDANAYLSALHALGTMDIRRSFKNPSDAYAAIRARVLVVGVASDILFPPAELRAAVDTCVSAGVDARYAEIPSGDGHDACLLEIDRVGELIRGFLRCDRTFA